MNPRWLSRASRLALRMALAATIAIATAGVALAGQRGLEEVKTAHDLGLQVAPYTANTEAEWKRLEDAHVDAIITDDPAGLLAWLRAQKPVLHP